MTYLVSTAPTQCRPEAALIWYRYMPWLGERAAMFTNGDAEVLVSTVHRHRYIEWCVHGLQITAAMSLLAS